MFFFKRKPRGPEIWDYPDLQSLCRSGAAYVREMARLRLREAEVFSLCIDPTPVVLSLCELLPTGPLHAALDFSRVHLFWAWERTGPADSAGQALEAVRRQLLQRTPFPPENLHPIPVQHGVENAVALYEQELERFFQLPVSPRQAPPWDMLLLSVGADGSLGALQPGSPALDLPERWVTALPDGRVALTLHALEGARNALLPAVGAQLRPLLERARQPDSEFRDLPAGGFAPAGRRVWLMEQQ